MPNRVSGWIIALLVLGSITAFLLMNLDTRPSRRGAKTLTTASEERASAPVPTGVPGGMIEYPIGDEAEKNHLRIAAVWLPSVHLSGDPDTSNDVIHLEADVRSTEGNPNGFAKEEFVPYLVIRYTIKPVAGGEPMSGSLVPMVARDGLHYGASVRMPGAGTYQLTYAIDPPSQGGLGRHDDPVTGVAPWWTPFQVSFDWDYEPVAPKNAPIGTDEAAASTQNRD